MGRLDEAIAALGEGLKADVRGGRDTFQGYKLVALAYLYLKKGDLQSCRNACLRAVKVDPSLPISMEAGALVARAGLPADAQNILQTRDSGNYHPISDIVLHRLQGEILLAQGRAAEALSEFQKVDALDMPARNRDDLVRTYLALGQPEKALPLVKRVAERPGQIWQQAEMSPPGAWADAVCQYADLGVKLGRSDASQAEYNCTRLRGAQGRTSTAQ
jgi:tetratricopeptide (TPR) repeat protein